MFSMERGTGPRNHGDKDNTSSSQRNKRRKRLFQKFHGEKFHEKTIHEKVLFLLTLSPLVRLLNTRGSITSKSSLSPDSFSSCFLFLLSMKLFDVMEPLVFNKAFLIWFDVRWVGRQSPIDVFP